MAAGAAQEPAAALSSDRFRVKISHVRGELRTTEPRPVFLRFDFDKESWVGETSVYSSSVNPVWTFAKQSHKLPSSSKENEDSEKFVARFDYKTEYAHRFHRKYLVVHLAERSPQGDVQWGSGRIPLESLARGCENVALSMIAQDDVTCFGTIRFSASMVNVAEVSVLLSDLKLLDYPARYSYDVKLVYFEFGFLGFQDGYRQCTERRSDSEPRFFTRPALKRDCTLPEMIAPSASEHGPLRVFFSVHRQVAKNRTEEIGLGALPIKMLFAKVNDGWMDVATKFKVPLHDQKGVLKGKVLLRNIPRFCQLPGEDLVNVNGVITPIDVDFSQRKIVPWLKLPRSLESQLKKPAKESPLDSADSQQSAGTSGMVNGIASISYDSSSSIGVNRLSRPGHVRRASGPEGAFLEPRSPVDGINFNLLSVAEGSASYPATPQITTSVGSGYLELKSPISGDMRPQIGQSSYGVTFSGSDSTVGLNGLSVSDATPSVNGVSYGLPSHAGETVTSERLDSTSIGNSESETLTTVRRSKSGKSVGSFGTHEGVPEIGSMLNSMTSEDCIHSSRTSAEDGMAGNSASTEQGEEDEWIAVKDPSNDLYYFASQYTQESLWLPPDWYREEDEFGRQIFVDRSTGRSQTFFPADEARQYRASVYAG